MHLGTILYTFFKGKLVGVDNYGNRYYQNNCKRADGRNKRWVLYKGISEPTKVPPQWHMWLHHATDKVSNKTYDWQKEHSPNLTGTDAAYYPKGHILSGGKRAKNTNDYEPFQPSTDSGESL